MPLSIPLSLADRIRNEGFTIVIVGATGWMGKASLDWFEEILGAEIFERVEAYGSRPQVVSLRMGRPLEIQPLERLAEAPSGRPTLFVHLAFLTKDKVSLVDSQTYLNANRSIDDAVVAAIKASSPVGVWLPSSGAVYRPDRTLDTNLESNPYGALKVEQEVRFSTLAEAHSFGLAIPRVFNLAGPHINKHSAYALSAILLDILSGGPVRLTANRPVIRSYVHVYDVIALATCQALATPQNASEFFDTAGEREIEIGELAELSARLLGLPQTTIERPTITEPANRYVGDGQDMFRLLRRHELTAQPLERQIQDTAAFLGAHP